MFIVIECFPDLENATIVTDPESGLNRVFDDRAAAEAEASECQNGIVFPEGEDGI